MKKLVIIGSGFMAGAIAGGVADENSFHIGILNMADPSGAEKLAASVKGEVCMTGDLGVADIVILAFKPQNFEEAAQQYGPYISDSTLVVSIMAGKKISEISARLGGTANIIRVMPNLAVSVRKGAVGYCPAEGVSEEGELMFRQIFEPLGVLAKVEEPLMSAVTALSGSGPAYFYYLCRYMKEEAVRLGFDEDTAEVFTRATLEGAAYLAADRSDSSFEELLNSITSAKGTTEAALNVFEEESTGEIIMNAVKAAYERSEELGR